MATPHHRHRSSLEGIIDFSTKPQLETNQRIKAKDRFYRIINHFENAENHSKQGPYKRTQLIRYTYEYARSEASKDNFLRAFYGATGLLMGEDGDDDFEQIESAFFEFANYLLDNFFLPCKAP